MLSVCLFPTACNPHIKRSVDLRRSLSPSTLQLCLVKLFLWRHCARMSENVSESETGNSFPTCSFGLMLIIILEMSQIREKYQLDLFEWIEQNFFPAKICRLLFSSSLSLRWDCVPSHYAPFCIPPLSRRLKTFYTQFFSFFSNLPVLLFKNWHFISIPLNFNWAKKLDHTQSTLELAQSMIVKSKWIWKCLRPKFDLDQLVWITFCWFFRKKFKFKNVFWGILQHFKIFENSYQQIL